MKGIVNDQLEPVITLVVYDQSGGPFGLEVLVDTGFTAELTLPRSMIDALGLVRADQERATLADSQVITCDTFEAEIQWQAGLRRVQVVELEQTPLIGMKLLAGNLLIVECHPGGEVSVESEQ